MTKSLSSDQTITITSSKDFEDLKKDYGYSAVKEICKSVKIFDHNSTATLEYFYDINDAIESAKDVFIAENNNNMLPRQVNVDVFCVKKDNEDFFFYFVEFMKESSSWLHGSTYASDEEVIKIFNQEESIDTTFLFDFEYESEDISEIADYNQ